MTKRLAISIACAIVVLSTMATSCAPRPDAKAHAWPHAGWSTNEPSLTPVTNKAPTPVFKP